MKRNIRTVACLTPLALATAAFGQAFSATPQTSITDTVTVDSNIVVAGGPVSITDVNVVVNISHSFDGDIDMILIPPGGTEYVSLSSDNGVSGSHFRFTRFDTAASTAITAGAALPPYRGAFIPETGTTTFAAGFTLPVPPTNLASLDTLNGRDSNGTWTLRIDDDAAGDVGVLHSWALEFNGAVSVIAPSVGSSTPATATRAVGDVVTFTVTALPGENPASTGMSVNVDLSPVGGSASQAFLDNGVAPDVTAGDNIFSYSHTITSVSQIGTTHLMATVSDAQGRSSLGQLEPQTLANGGSGLPTATVNLGSLVNPTTVSGTVTGFAGAGNVKWIRMDISAVAAASGTYLDIDTNGAGAGNTFTDSTIALYDNAGARVAAQDTDDGPSLFSKLSFGDTSPVRPAIGAVLPATAAGSTHAGADGPNLAAGTYWLGIGGTGTTFNATNWSFTSTSTQAGDVAYIVTLSSDSAPTNPTAVGSSSGTLGACGGTVLATVTVTPGTNPTSTGIAVTLDTTLIGGAPGQALLDNGTNGDVTAGDNIFSANINGAGGSFGTFNLPFSVTDAQARSTNGTLAVTRATDEGDLPATAKQYYGTFPPSTTLAGNITSGTDVDMYAICVSDTANFSASLVGGATYDTQLFLFNSNGTGAAMNDDFEDDSPINRQSFLNIATSANPTAVLASGGLYYLGMTGFNRDPITSATATDTIWAAQSNTAQFEDTWGPNGVTPNAPVVGWTGSAATGAYTITLSGGGTVCPADLSNTNLTAQPDCAVDINDLLFFLGAFEAGSADIADVNVTGNPDCATDINDLLFFLARFEAGC